MFAERDWEGDFGFVSEGMAAGLEKKEEKKDPLRPLRGHLPRKPGGGGR